MPQLASLNLAGNNICYDWKMEGLDAIIAVLPKLPNLSSLNVDEHPLPIDELKGIKVVESIDLSGKKLGVMSAIIISACIAGNAHLRELNLDNNQLCGIDDGGDGDYTTEGITTLFEGIKQSNITTLSLADNNICYGGKMEGLNTLTAAIKEMPNLSSLNLNNNWLGKTGAVELAKALPECKALISLSLNGNQLCGVHLGRGTFTIKGITVLCEGIKQSNIQSLSVRDNHIGDDGKCTLLAARPDLDLQL